MFKVMFLRSFLFLFIFAMTNFSFASTVDMGQNEEYEVMTKDIVCVPAMRDGRVLFSDKRSYVKFAEHLKVAGFDPQVIPYEKLKKNLMENVGNKEQERIICKDLIFLFLEGFTILQEELNAND